MKPIFSGYTGFLNCLEEILINSLVHVHTLNHDLFFERLNSTEWLSGNFMTDGFDELGSPYYGKIEGNMVRLSCFTNEYNSNLRLYKLHGSVDQYLFHTFGNYDRYKKIKEKVGTTNLYKEITNKKGQLEYINDWINYHSDFLSGTTSKILRYKEPFYENLFTLFEANLSNSEELIIIGYGAKDVEINEIIETHYDYRNKPIRMINLYPDKAVEDFCHKFNTSVLELDLNIMTLENVRQIIKAN
jgi:hypothetical protein